MDINLLIFLPIVRWLQNQTEVWKEITNIAQNDFSKISLNQKKLDKKHLMVSILL